MLLLPLTFLILHFSSTLPHTHTHWTMTHWSVVPTPSCLEYVCAYIHLHTYIWFINIVPFLHCKHYLNTHYLAPLVILARAHTHTHTNKLLTHPSQTEMGAGREKIICNCTRFKMCQWFAAQASLVHTKLKNSTHCHQ